MKLKFTLKARRAPRSGGHPDLEGSSNEQRQGLGWPGAVRAGGTAGRGRLAAVPSTGHVNSGGWSWGDREFWGKGSEVQGARRGLEWEKLRGGGPGGSEEGGPGSDR